MKIAYVYESELPSISASSIQVVAMCKAFSDLGHQVTLIVPEKKGDKTSEQDIWQYYSLEPCFEILEIPLAKFWPRPIAFAIYAFKSTKATLNSKVDLLYSRFLPTACVCSFAGQETAFEAHVPPRNQRPSFLVDLCFRLWQSAKSKKSLICISAALAKYFEQSYGCSSALIARDATDTPGDEQLGQADFIDSSNSLLNIGYIGHLYPGKGMETISALLSRCPDYHFHIAGGSPEHLEFWRNKLSSQDNVTLYGHLSPKEAERLRLSCDVLLAPYLQEVRVCGAGKNVANWMSPLKIFEYMASGKAIVCSDLAVLREILVDQKTALLCEAGNIDAWEEAVTRLAMSPDLRTKLGKNARTEQNNKHTWLKRAEKIISFLNQRTVE